MNTQVNSVSPPSALADSRRGRRQLTIVLCGAGVAIGLLAAGVAVATTSDELPHAAGPLRERLLAEVGPELRELGEPAFVALDEKWAPLADGGASTRASTEEADSAYVLYGSDENHAVKVYVGEGTDASTAASCGIGGEQGPLECEITKLSEGTLLTTTWAFERQPSLGGAPMIVSDARRLADADLASLRFEKNFRFFHLSGAMTSVTESVNRPTSTDPAAQFSVSQETLVGIASDPELSWN